MKSIVLSIVRGRINHFVSLVCGRQQCETSETLYNGIFDKKFDFTVASFFNYFNKQRANEIR
jgi:hypothetical protein